VIRAALTSGKPAIVEIPIDPDEFPTPAQAVRWEHGARRVTSTRGQRQESTSRRERTSAVRQPLVDVVT